MPAYSISGNKRIDIVSKTSVKYKDFFNLEELYKAIYFWLKDYEWTGTDGKFETSGEEDAFETMYHEVVYLGNVKEIWMWWRLVKDTGNPYIRWHMDIDWHILGLKVQEIMVGGNKVKAHMGECEIIIKTYIEYDYKRQWEKNIVLNYFSDIFPKRIYRRRLYEEHKKDLYEETYILQTFIKKWLKLKNYIPFEQIEAYHPSYSYPSHTKL